MQDQSIHNETRTDSIVNEGRSTESRASAAIRVAFIVVCALCLILPLVGMLWAPTTQTTENRNLAELPSLEQDGSINAEFLSELGTYFEDHFAYRNELVTANAKLRAALGTSATNSVIIGDDGWLFYGGTTAGYVGKGRLTEQEIDNLAFDFSLIQGYCNANDANFALAIVPNKNSIYPEKMPFYFGKAADGAQLDDLNSKLNEEKVNNVDLYALLKDAKEGSPESSLYYKLDTHWNQRGALLACEDLLDVLGRYEASKELASIPESQDSEAHVGDLSEMLYPSAPQSEHAPSLHPSVEYETVEGANEIDTEASAWIETRGEGAGTLYMFRDSFAQNMVPFLSSVYAESFFDWYVPFDYTKIEGRNVTDVVVEKAERSLKDLAKSPGIMPAPSFDLSDDEIASIGNAPGPDGKAPTIRRDGSFVVIEGSLPSSMSFEGLDDFFLMVSNGTQSTCYVPFRVSANGDSGSYQAYVYAADFEGATNISVLMQHGDKIEKISETQIDES